MKITHIITGRGKAAAIAPNVTADDVLTLIKNEDVYMAVSNAGRSAFANARSTETAVAE